MLFYLQIIKLNFTDIFTLKRNVNNSIEFNAKRLWKDHRCFLLKLKGIFLLSENQDGCRIVTRLFFPNYYSCEKILMQFFFQDMKMFEFMFMLKL